MTTQSLSKILLVEDHVISREMLTRRLVRRGYSVVCAADGHSAVSMSEAELPDVILMDVALGEMDGWEATQLIKNNPATRAIPIIALTAHSLESDRKRSFEVGCSDFETKPIDLERLLGKIRVNIAEAAGVSAQPTRRCAARHKTLKSATLLFGSGGGVSCIVRDMSDAGAKNDVTSSQGIPRLCGLRFDGNDKARDCVIVWSKQNSVGVKFV